MLNSNLLRAKMAEHNKTQSEVAVEAGMSINTLSRKITGKIDFRLSEVERICAVLNIDDPIPIFFTSSVPTAQRTA